jgi:predicted transcriptional regulator
MTVANGQKGGKDVRESIRLYIRNHPGQPYAKIQQIFQMSRGTMRYHLDRLERSGKIRRESRDGKVYIFPTDMRLVPRYDGPPLTEIENTIWETVSTNPGLSQKQLAIQTRTKRLVLQYHLKKLLDRGVLHSRKRGRNVRYYHRPPDEVIYLAKLDRLVYLLLTDHIDWNRFRNLKERLRRKYGVMDR